MQKLEWTTQAGKEFVGKFGYGDRNVRGGRLSILAKEHELAVCNLKLSRKIAENGHAMIK
jgi:hypothetical protein